MAAPTSVTGMRVWWNSQSTTGRLGSAMCPLREARTRGDSLLRRTLHHHPEAVGSRHGSQAPRDQPPHGLGRNASAVELRLWPRTAAAGPRPTQLAHPTAQNIDGDDVPGSIQDGCTTRVDQVKGGKARDEDGFH